MSYYRALKAVNIFFFNSDVNWVDLNKFFGVINIELKVDCPDQQIQGVKTDQKIKKYSKRSQMITKDHKRSKMIKKDLKRSQEITSFHPLNLKKFESNSQGFLTYSSLI